jgi:hypothetical protein
MGSAANLEWLGYQAAHNMLRAHAKAYRVYQSRY